MTTKQAANLKEALKAWFLPKEFYEQDGLWTPAFAGTGTAGTFTYVSQIGYYTRVGAKCAVWADVRISAIGTPPTGNMTITGLPFTSASGVDSAFYLGFVSQFNYSAAVMDLTLDVSASSTTILIFESFDNLGAGNAPAANFTNAACRMILSGSYRIA